MNRLIFLIIALLSTETAGAQVTKRNWLMGGTGNFSSKTFTNGSLNQTYKETHIQLQPDIAYFFIDRLAAGIKLNMSFHRNKVVSDNYNLGKDNSYGFGPFIRYYILDTDGRFNFLVEGNYQYQIERGGGVSSDNSEPVPVPMTQYTKNAFGLAGGPVFYFNRSVGLEFLAGYNFTRYVENKSATKNFHIGLGLQVHLERE